MVAEVWLPAKLKFSVFVGIEWICKRAKFADLFAKIFIPFNVPPKCGYFLQKEYLGFLFIVNSKEVYLIF